MARFNFVWDLTEDAWLDYPYAIQESADSCSDHAVNFAGVVGCCRTGDLCFDLRAWGTLDNNKCGLGYELFVGGVDIDYAETNDGYPYDMVLEYGEFPLKEALAMDLDDFKAMAEKEFEAFIVKVAVDYNHADLIEKANEPLNVW